MRTEEEDNVTWCIVCVGFLTDAKRVPVYISDHPGGAEKRKKDSDYPGWAIWAVRSLGSAAGNSPRATRDRFRSHFFKIGSASRILCPIHV